VITAPAPAAATFPVGPPGQPRPRFRTGRPSACGPHPRPAARTGAQPAARSAENQSRSRTV